MRENNIALGLLNLCEKFMMTAPYRDILVNY